MLPFTSVAIGIALIYAGYTFYSRHDANARAQQAIEDKKSAELRDSVERMGGDQLKILNFSARPGVFRRGEKGVLCYAVNNAVAVKIEPGIEPVKPSLTRCVDIAPKQDTTYTLTATDKQGKTQTASLSIAVR